MKNDRRRRYKLLIYSKIRRKCRRKKNEEKNTFAYNKHTCVFILYFKLMLFPYTYKFIFKHGEENSLLKYEQHTNDRRN